MAIDISQFRASIGTFNLKYKWNIKTKISYKEKGLSYKYKSAFKLGVSYKFLMTLLIYFLISHEIMNRSEGIFNEVYKNYTKSSSLNFEKYLSRSEPKHQYYKYTIISNFQSKYMYGNRKLKGMRICHWNKSNSSIQAKLPEIKNLISKERPHFIGIYEANVKSNLDLDVIKYQIIKYI